MGTQRPIWVAGQKEGVLHVPRGVLGRKIQGRKVVPVVLHFRALGHGESHAAKNVDEFVANLTHGVVRPGEVAPTWARDVFGVDTNLWFGIRKFRNLGLYGGFKLVEELTDLFAGLGCDGLEVGKKVVHDALAAEKTQAQGLSLLSVRRGR